jgi:hypothetical protein
MEKVITSILAALSPILFSYIFKNIENRNKSNVRKSELDEAQKRLDFLHSYFNVQTGFGQDGQSALLKEQLYKEVEGIKAKIDNIYTAHEETTPYSRLYTFQKIFLTFKPLTFWGWLWHVIFYLGLVFCASLLMGYFTDNDGNFTNEAFSKNIQDWELVGGTLFFIVLVIGSNLAALRSYKLSSDRSG